jgi:hypothetical protein
MRLITSKTWPLLAGLALLCTSLPFFATGASGAQSSPLATPVPETGVKVHGAHGGNQPTPAPVTYGTLDGTWEVQAQPGAQTQYSHLFLLTSGDSISGTWRRENGKTPNSMTPISGTQSSDRFTINGSDAKGPFSFTGYIENDATMIGQITEGRVVIPFTATHQGLPLNERPPKHKRQKHHHGQQP